MMIAYVYLSRLVSSHHAALLINLCLALVVANVIFLSGVDKTSLHVRASLYSIVVLTGGFRHVQHVRPNRGPHKSTKIFSCFCNMVLKRQKY